jgi:GAF domain-containing protein
MMPDVLGQLLRACRDLPGILECTLERSLTVTGARFGNIQLINWPAARLEIAAHQGFDESFLKFFAHVGADDGSACGRALRARSAIIVEDVETDAAFWPPSRDIVLNAGVRAVQSMPLISTSGAFVGMLSTHFADVRSPSGDELSAMHGLVRLSADAIIHHRARRPDFIARSMDTIAASRNLILRISKRQKEEQGRFSTKGDPGHTA